MPVITADGCFCPSDPAASLSLTGMSRQTPALQLGVSPAPTPWRPAAPGAPTERVAAVLGGVNHCPYLGRLSVLPCRPGFPHCPFCLCLLQPLLPLGLHLLPLCRQLPDLLEGMETQPQAGLVSAPGGACFGSDLHWCPLPQAIGRQRSAPFRMALCTKRLLPSLKQHGSCSKAAHVPATLSCSLQRTGVQRWTWLEELAPACLPPSSWGSCLDMAGTHCKETPGVSMSTGQVGLPFLSGIKVPQAGARSGGGGAVSHGTGEPFLSPIRCMGEEGPSGLL